MAEKHGGKGVEALGSQRGKGSSGPDGAAQLSATLEELREQGQGRDIPLNSIHSAVRDGHGPMAGNGRGLMALLNRDSRLLGPVESF